MPPQPPPPQLPTHPLTAPSTVCSLQTSCAHSGGTGVSPVVRVMQHQRREGAGEGFFLLLPPLASGGHSKCFWGKKKERKKENQRQSFPVSRNLLPIRALPGASAWFSGANDSSAECFFQGPRWRQTAGFAFTQDFAHKRPRTSPVASITRGVDSSPGASAGGADRATARRGSRRPGSGSWLRCSLAVGSWETFFPGCASISSSSG